MYDKILFIRYLKKKLKMKKVFCNISRQIICKKKKNFCVTINEKRFRNK